MARTSTTKTAAGAVAIEKTMATDNTVADKNMNEKNKVSVEPLKDSDEINVVSLIPNVSYKDNYTNDYYQWEEVGHVELMTFETLKNLWRNHKGYFRDMRLKPDDDRVINKFGLTRIYEKYEFLMDESNYNRKNIDKLCTIISETPNGLKYSIVNKVKDMVVTGKLTDIAVIRALEKHFNLDLISFLN